MKAFTRKEFVSLAVILVTAPVFALGLVAGDTRDRGGG